MNNPESSNDHALFEFIYSLTAHLVRRIPPAAFMELAVAVTLLMDQRGLSGEYLEYFTAMDGTCEITGRTGSC